MPLLALITASVHVCPLPKSVSGTDCVYNPNKNIKYETKQNAKNLKSNVSGTLHANTRQLGAGQALANRRHSSGFGRGIVHV